MMIRMADGGGSRAEGGARRADSAGYCPLPSAIRPLPFAIRHPPSAIRHLLLPALLLLIAPHVFAAVSTSALTGRVTSAGKPVAAATITATSPMLQAPRVTTTGASGTYWLGALPPGEYDVTFEHKGMQSLTRRAVVELARIARADAQLEASEDEESVTSTATTISVVHDTALSTHRNTKQLDQLPVPIDFTTALYLDPDRFPNAGSLDGDVIVLQSETVDEMTFIRAVTPLELARGGSAALIERTRTGGEDFTFSLRDTITKGGRHFGEVTSGGRIIPNRLWFFAAGWNGQRADRFGSYQKGFDLKLTAQLDERQNLTAAHSDEFVGLTYLDHVAQWTPRFLTEMTASHLQGYDQNSASAKASFVAGDHVLSAGMDGIDANHVRDRSFFFNDRIWRDRWLLNAGVRYGRLSGAYDPSGLSDHADGVSAQLATAYDLRGRGRNAITASAARYWLYDDFHIDEFTLGYVMALGSTGAARLNFIHNDYASQHERTLVQLDSNYRLFDRFEAGLNYTYTRSDLNLPAHTANAWLSADIPIGEQAIGVMIAYRLLSSYRYFSLGDESLFDVALRYTVPIKRVALTIGADAANLFDQTGFAGPPPKGRVTRGWVRLRL